MKTSKHGEVAALRLVIEGTVAETGKDFFRALVRNLSAALGTLGAWVTEYLPAEKKMRALAMWMKGGFVAHFEYPISGTACETVVENRALIHIPERLIELYPRDDDLVPLNAVSYLGMPLLDTDGNVMGHLSVLDDQRMPRDERAISLFEVFAARAAAELRRLRVELEVRAREAQLAALLESALDAILVLDERLRVARINPAAARLFGCTPEDLLGEPLGEFMSPESAALLAEAPGSLAARPADQRRMWLPQDLVARRWDHTVFPAEATLSRFESQGETFYTVILRNVDERLEAQRQIERLTAETERLREAVRDLSGHDDLLGRSEGMRAVFAAIQQVAPTDASVLIHGETGTGKELVARAIHRAGTRAESPLVVVNCAAIPANLIESEFFGHERGAFTGATTRREGRFALANGGMVFLDEIGELPLELQPKLLRVLQEGEFEPLGGTRTVKVDVRVVAATHRDLRQMVAEGRFREDLYFRLNVFPIHLPALRERDGDVEQLAAVFAERCARRMGKRLRPLTPDQLARVRAYHWPGNVRELQNVIERAVILTADGDLQLERAMAGLEPPALAGAGGSEPPAEETTRVLTVRELEAVERANLERALAACGGRIAGEQGAARLLGLPPSTLSSRMKALGVPRPPG